MNVDQYCETERNESPNKLTIIEDFYLLGNRISGFANI